jgi:hypothetical protein
MARDETPLFFDNEVVTIILLLLSFDLARIDCFLSPLSSNANFALPLSRIGPAFLFTWNLTIKRAIVRFYSGMGPFTARPETF